jgi:hypothetical protein
MCYIEDWMTEEKGDFYFSRELGGENDSRSLNAN